VALVTSLGASPAQADNLGAIGQGAALLVAPPVAAGVLLLVGVPAWLFARRPLRPGLVAAALAALGLALTAAALVATSMIALMLSDEMRGGLGEVVASALFLCLPPVACAWSAWQCGRVVVQSLRRRAAGDGADQIAR
jgi:hypothetical protein